MREGYGMVLRWETEVGPNGVKRFIRVPAAAPPPTRMELDRALVELQADAEAAAAQMRDVRQRIRELVADARRRETLRRRLALHSRREAERREREGITGVKGKHLARARFLAAVSQRQLASAWGLSRSGLAAAEHDERRMPVGVAKWARQILRVSGEWEEPQEEVS